MNILLASGIGLLLGLPVFPAFSQDSSPAEIHSLFDQGSYQMAPAWQRLNKTHDAAVFLHAERKKTETGYAVWLHHELAYPEYLEKERAYLSVRERVVVDCKSSRTGVTDVAYYAGRWGGGAVVGTSSVHNPAMSNIVPDSTRAHLALKTCAPKPRPSIKPKQAVPAKTPG